MIKLQQDPSIEYLLLKTNMVQYKQTKSPMSTKISTEESTAIREPEQLWQYSNIIRSLQYLPVKTRQNIAIIASGCTYIRFLDGRTQRASYEGGKTSAASIEKNTQSNARVSQGYWYSTFCLFQRGLSQWVGWKERSWRGTLTKYGAAKVPTSSGGQTCVSSPPQKLSTLHLWRPAAYWNGGDNKCQI